MTNTITSLSLIKVQWDDTQTDYIENFVPFVIALIAKKGYSNFDTHQIVKDFEQEYGLKVPYLPMVGILTRVKKRGFIKATEKGIYQPITNKIQADDFYLRSQEQLREFNKIIKEFTKYCLEIHGKTITEEKAETIFISFLKDHDLAVLFATQGEDTLLPEVHASNAEKYLIFSFVKSAYDNEPGIFDFILNLAIGHFLASTILYKDFDRFQGRMAGINFYLDTGFLFNVLGISTPEAEDAYIEFLNILRKNKANLFVFRHTYDEFMGILENCLHWLERGDYDRKRASRSLSYFLAQRASASDVEDFIASAEMRLNAFGIKVVDAPEAAIDTSFQIDETNLIDRIVELHQRKDPYFDEVEREGTLYRDARSIAAIYKLRKGKKPIRLTDTKHLFLTSNASLAKAAQEFHTNQVESKFFTMPAAVTDVLLGTLLWFSSSPQVEAINRKKLIADCVAALQPTHRLITKLAEEAEKLQASGKISEQEVLLLLESRVSRNILGFKTLGDPSRVNDKTTLELLDDVKKVIQEQERKKRIISENNFKVVKEKIEGLATIIGLVFGWSYFIASNILILFIVAYEYSPSLLQSFNFPVDPPYWLKVLAAILLFLNVVTGFNIVGSRNWIFNYFRKTIVGFFTKGVTSNES